MNSPVSFEREGRIGLLRIDNPPVNAISPEVVQGLVDALERFDAAGDLDALVVYCAGRTFVAGGDIAAFERPDFSAVPYNAALGRLEASARPVVAALHGTALGGGLELAMACHHRVAVPSTRFGQPEVRIGLIPGSLGTQRLPRLVGAPLALELIASGRMIGAQQAREAGLVDEVKEGEPRDIGIAAAQALVAAGTPPRRASELSAAAPPAGLFEQAAVDAANKPAYPALGAIVRAVRAAVEQPYSEGEAIEAREFDALVRSPSSRALRHLFFAEREAAKIRGLPRDTRLRPIRKVGIVGAGTMGGGIAMSLANAGLPVTLVETSDEALQRGLGLVRRNFEASAARGRLTAAQVEQRTALLGGSLELASLADCDLIVEAVFEDLALKEEVCARLGALARPGAIVATNTSTLDVDALARASGRPADFLGMHFFSPANVMRLLEVVRGRATAPDVLATAMKLAGTIGKVAVVSGVCWGFIGNRMAEVYMREAEFLLLEGAQPAQIDAAVERLENLGMAMGPCRMLDMAGIDVGARTVIERGKAGGLPADPSYRAVAQKLFALGRLGQKSGAGYYRYDGRTPTTDDALSPIVGALAAEHGVVRRAAIGDDEIVERLLYPLIAEGVRLLEEGIACRPGDIDVVWVFGYGFPDHRGGPMFMADEIGLPRIVERLRHYATQRGDAFGYWTPPPLLERLAADGRRLSDWRADAGA